jgi:hypothetical protein
MYVKQYIGWIGRLTGDEMNWIKIEKRLPEDDRQVFALSGQCAYLANYREGKWWITYTIGLGGVTRWMDLPGEPKDFSYWKNRLIEWWSRRKVNAQQTSDWLTGWTSKNAQLDKKIVYWTNASGEIRMGMPEHFPASKGFQKVVCNNTFEAEKWSDRLRQYNLTKEKAKDEERDRFEGPIRSEIKNRMQRVMKNSRNQINHDFVARYMEKMDRDRTKMSREEYLHSEGHEHGR